MAHLRAQRSVRGSIAETEAALESYFASLRDRDGVARLRLRVPMSGHALAIDREVRVEARRGRDSQNLNDLTLVSWHPEGSIVFPAFTGTLIVSGDDDPGCSLIELEGDYTPPMGATGELFDAAIGHRIAESTARELLGDLKRATDKVARVEP